MINLKSKIFLFCSSYTPLFLIMLIQNHNVIVKNISDFSNIFEKEHVCFIINFLIITKIFINPVTILLILFLSGICFLLYLLKKHNEFAQDKIEVSEIENVTSESMTYIITYLIPFLSLNLNSTINLYCILLLIITIGIIYVNSDMLYINPLLNFFGYKTFKISGKILNHNKKVKDVFLITPRKIPKIYEKNIVNFLQYEDEILIAKSISQKQ